MRISVLGTGVAGRTLAEAFAARGHDVVNGTRDVTTTLGRTEPEGSESYADWAAAHPDIRLVPYAEAGEHGEVLVNATSGQGSLDALRAAGEHDGTVIVDVSNPLDFSAGFPPTLSVVNTDSVGEQLQREFPEARVVKTLNTVNCRVMVDPASVPGEHQVFIAGEDDDAKVLVVGLLCELGWPAERVLDLGGIHAARATEMYLPLWIALMGPVGSPMFNIQVMQG